MKDRKISLSERIEETRDKNEISDIPVQFELNEIRQHFYDSLLDIRKQISIANEINCEGRIEEAKDIWRAQIVYIEGIIDFYLHELSKYAIVRMFSGKWEKSDNYGSFKIPMNDVERGIRNPESTEWLFEHVNTRFSSETYLSPEKVGQQLSLIGLSLDDISMLAFPKSTDHSSNFCKKQMKNLFQRRNQIAHQADRKHSNAEKEDIDYAFVNDAVNFATKFIDAIHSKAIQKETS